MGYTEAFVDEVDDVVGVEVVDARIDAADEGPGELSALPPREPAILFDPV